MSTQKTRFIPANSTMIPHPTGEKVGVVYCYDAPPHSPAAPRAVAYRGRRTKAEWHIAFTGERSRQDAIDRFFAEQSRNQADLARWDAEKKAARAKARDLQALAGDLAEACQAATNAARESDDDGGACNFDSLELWLPGAPLEKVQAIFDGLKLAYFRLNGRWVVSPPVGGQGFRRTRAARAMAGVMSAAGWDASTRFVMD